MAAALLTVTTAELTERFRSKRGGAVLVRCGALGQDSNPRISAESRTAGEKHERTDHTEGQQAVPRVNTAHSPVTPLNRL